MENHIKIFVVNTDNQELIAAINKFEPSMYEVSKKTYIAIG